MMMDSENEYKKRQRTILSNEQTKYLQNYFYHNTFPSKEERDGVAKRLGMQPRTIQIWFQNMRQKVKNRTIDLQNSYKKKFDALQLLAEGASMILEGRKKK